LAALVKDLMQDYPEAKVIGHRDVPGVHKECPGFTVAAWAGTYTAPVSALLI